MLSSPFTPDYSFTTTVSTGAAATSLGSGAGSTVRVYNAGSAPVFLALGSSTVTAVTTASSALKNCAFVPPTSTVLFSRDPTNQTHISLISGTSGQTVYVGTGEGGLG